MFTVVKSGHRETPRHSKAAILLFTLMVVALALLLFHGLTLISRISETGDADVDNRTWLVAQLEVDSKNLLLRLEKAKRTNGSHLSPEIADGIRQAFDIYYSRVSIVEAALGTFEVTEHIRRSLDRIASTREEMAAIIDAPGALDFAAVERLSRIAENDAPNIRILTSEALQLFAQLAEDERNGHRSMLIRLELLMAVLVILMICAIILAVRVSRAAIQRAAQAAQIASNLRLTIEASLDAVLVSDECGMILQCNAAAVHIFGFERNQLLGKTITETLIPAEGRQAFSEAMVGNSSEDPPAASTGRFRLMALHASGYRLPVEVSLASDSTSEGLRIFITFIRDISDEVEAESNLRDARDQARKDAEAKGRFLSIMSHEMRTPLHGVIAGLDLVDCSRLSAKNRRFVKMAQECAQSALRQIDEILVLTRSGESEGPLVFYDPVALAKDITSELQALAAEQGNRLRLDVLPASNNLQVLGRPRNFRLVLVNLVGNAIKFTRDGEIVVTILCRKVADDRAALTVSVSDTGIGIAPADQVRIFEEFETLDDSTRRAYGGVGLGLALAKAAVERMGGRIELDSEPGIGSRFFFTLHLYARTIDPVRAVAPPPSAPLVLTGGSKRILVVDDNAVNLTLLAEMISRLGHNPELAASGPEAITMAARSRFDLIMMDIAMPEMDGLTAMSEIRLGGASRETPVVGVTAFVAPDDRDGFLKAGMVEILPKPINLSQLHQFLHDLFDTEPVRQAVTAHSISAEFEEVRAVMGDEKTRHLVQQVKRDAEVALATMTAGITTAAPDFAAIQSSVHRAAGSASVIGATQLASILRRAEAATREKAISDLITLEPQLKTAIETWIDEAASNHPIS